MMPMPSGLFDKMRIKQDKPQQQKQTSMDADSIQEFGKSIGPSIDINQLLKNRKAGNLKNG